MEVFRKILVYLGLRKGDPDSPTSDNLKIMHGINKISLLMFLAAVIYLIYRAWFR